MNEQIRWKHQKTARLHHHDDCYITGLTQDQSTLFVGELYENDCQALHQINLTDYSMQTWAESPDQLDQPQFSQPSDLIEPTIVSETTQLQTIGARWRGMREAENLVDLVQPLSVMEKMAIIKHLNLSISAMMLFGIADSRVLAEAHLHDNLYFVCRRIRLAIALPEVKRDADHQPYDYDTIPLEIAHLYDAETDEAPSISASFTTFSETRVKRPMDCLFHDGRLYIADGGTSDHVSQIHIFELNTLMHL